MTVPAESPKDPAPAVRRSLRILTLLAEARGAPMTLSDVARALGIAKSSTANLCQVLEEGGMIQRFTSGYVLGRRTAELGGAYLSQFDQVREFYTWVTGASLLRNELVQLAVLDGTEVIYLARHAGRSLVQVTASLGHRFPAAPTALGNALLTTLSNDEIRSRFSEPHDFPARTPDSVRTVEALINKIDRARELGYASDFGEVHMGVSGVATVVPPWSSGDQPLALGTSLMQTEVTQEFMDQAISELRAGINQLSNPLVEAHANTLQYEETRSVSK